MITDFEPSDDFRVNSVVADEQDHPRTVALEDGRFLIVWRSGWGGWISGQIYEHDGTPVGGEFRISDWHIHPLTDFGAAALPGGGFAVTWGGNPNDVSSDTDVILQIFDGSGQRQSGAIVVNQVTGNVQYNPAVALLANGNFIVTWDQLGGPGNQVTTVDVKAQIFTPSGARVGSEFVVNTTTLDSQEGSTVTPLKEGGFVVAWHDGSRTNPYGDTGFTAAQVFTDTGARVGPEFRVNTVAQNDQRGATIAALSNGGFVVAWTDTSSGSTFAGGYPAKFQLFTAAGAKIGGEVTIDTSGTSPSDSIRVTELAGGGFIASWVDEVWSASGFILSSQVFGQVYDEAGQPVGGRLTLSAQTPYHWDSSIESLADGSFVVTYQTSESGGSFERDVHARLFTALRGGETLHGTDAGESLAGAGLDDFLGGHGGNDVLSAGAGEDMLDGGNGDDQLDGGADSDRLTGGAGNDQLNGGTGADIADGGAGDDQLDGGAESDRLIGGAGNDRLDGGAGADRMAGGSGDDVYIVDDSGDLVVEAPGQGTDEVRTALASYVLPVGVERLTGLSSSGQSLTGGAGADTITGGDGDDSLNGLGGDDLLDGGAGADTMTGGLGNDAYLIDSADSVVEAAGGGTDEIRTAAASYTLATPNVENLRGLSDAGQALTGDDGNNRIEGAAGADLLDGAGGADTLVGGVGADSLAGGGGNDVLNGGADADSLAGGEANDNLDGSAGSDTLAGGDGDDVLKFGAAAGSGDVDTIDGGGGFDVLVATFGAATDPAGLHHSIVQDADGSYSGWYAQGSERVEFSGIEAFQITGSTSADQLLGGAFADFLFGGAGNDLIEGGDGNDLIVGAEGSDMLVGGAGDDHYVVSDDSDTIAEQQDGGIDQVDASTASFTLGANIENLTGTANGAQTLTGNGLANRITALGGGSLLQGAGGDDVLEGGSGFDTLDGGSGADTMRGGNGDDIYLVDNAGDLVVDSNGFSDEIRTGLAEYTLTSASGVENLTGLATTGQILTGTATRNTLKGGSGDDRLLGMGGNDILNGGAGADYLDDGIFAGFMSGGTGDDTYVADYTGESIFEAAGEGIDRVLTNLATFTLPNNVELLTGTVDTGQDLRGNTASNVITGGAGNDIVTGGSGNDVLDGGAGADTLRGGTGNDVLWVDDAGDVVDEKAGEGTDEVRTGLASFSLAALANVENLTGLAATGQILTGNAGANLITAGVGNDVIDGGGGADTMAGGAGNDAYYVDNIGDVVTENLGEGTDEIRTSLGLYSLLGTNVENLAATTDLARDFRGNSGSNVLTGGGGNDLLRLNDGGDDTANGGAGSDILYFGSAFTGADIANGGDGRDVLVLQGNYTLTLSATNIANLESISLQSGARTTWGDTANNFYDYNVTMADANVTAGQQLIVNGQSLRAGEDFTFDGSAETDGKFLVYGGNGVDHFTGGSGNDVFFFEGDRWGPSDTVNGGAGRDALIISSGTGLAHIEFGATSLTSIESISVNARFATDPSARPSYELVLDNGNVAPGAALILNASSLTDPIQTVMFDGSAVQDGVLIMFGGAGSDVLIGGDGADRFEGRLGGDRLTGGAGADTFRYTSVSDSDSAAPDQILDFASGVDKIDLSAIDADGFTGGDQAFHWIGSEAFSAQGSASAGELRAWLFDGSWYVEGDTNGDGFADLVIKVMMPSAPVVESDFLL